MGVCLLSCFFRYSVMANIFSGRKEQQEIAVKLSTEDLLATTNIQPTSENAFENVL